MPILADPIAMASAIKIRINIAHFAWCPWVDRNKEVPSGQGNRGIPYVIIAHSGMVSLGKTCGEVGKEKIHKVLCL